MWVNENKTFDLDNHDMIEESFDEFNIFDDSMMRMKVKKLNLKKKMKKMQ